MRLNLRPRTHPEVNLTSLIDVVLLLLIFFMVSTSFVKQSQIAISLPEADSASVVEEVPEQVDIMITEAGTFLVNGRELIILKNDTAGAAVFTIKVPTPNDLSGIVTVPDDTINIATGKTYLLRPQSAYKQSDGRIYIDCDVAGKVLVYGE